VASAVYRAIRQQRPERIVLLAFPHHGGLRGVAVPEVDAIQTPLGELEIDRDFLPELPRQAEDRLCDHSFEIQIPFLQKAAPGARVTPIYVGRMNAEETAGTADALAAAWQPGTLFVASSDFTHYGRAFGYTPFPVDDDVEQRLRQLDFECIDAAGSLDSTLFRKTLEETGATVCGSDPIALLQNVLARLGGDEIYQLTLDYQTSGEITGDYHHSVSYAALVYCRREAFDVEAADREVLLDSAEATLQHLRDCGKREAVIGHGSTALASSRGVFVSLHRGEELLGCIGNYIGRESLRSEVAHMALSAALDDPRFHPAARTDGPIDIEISVLTPLKRITGCEQFHVGRHGALLQLGAHTGLLLPQVAEGRAWTAEDFLKALAWKGTLGPHAWKDPKARLYIFEAQVFSRPGLRARS
jgi:AmmeMemoRadiSam system protein B/AmmeMemoRadiSam system protein A